METDNNLEQAFLDVRNAYRLLAQLQLRIRDLVFYIKGQTVFANSDCGGKKYFSDYIRNRSPKVDQYANLRIMSGMWTWDYFPGYLFEYYLAETKAQTRRCRMSLMAVCDDGYAISGKKNRAKTDISTFAPADESHSYIVMMYGDKGGPWMDNDQEHFIYRFLKNGKTSHRITDEKDRLFYAKKYPMVGFFNQERTDALLKDFAEEVMRHGGENILRDKE